jgi:ornithine carbamoyltransferase
MKKQKQKRKQDFISIADFDRDMVFDILTLTRQLKSQPFRKTLQNKTVGLIFQKPSTRTAVSFAVGVSQLGGQPLLLNADVLQIKRGETPKDTARVLSRYLSAIVVRANHHSDVLEMAGFADIPVINGLTDQEHPCQVLADLFTIMEHRKMKHPKELKGFRVVYLGDGNNVAQSWMLAASLLGMKLVLACPKNYEPRKDYFEMAQTMAKKGGGSVDVVSDPSQAVQGAQALYTDVWTSMGQEAESQKRREALSVYQLNSFLMSMAQKNALVMHCLPAHRGEEITDDVIEGPNSVVFDQAANRLHVQKAVMSTLL